MRRDQTSLFTLAMAVVAWILVDEHDHADVEERTIYLSLTDWIDGYTDARGHALRQIRGGI